MEYLQLVISQEQNRVLSDLLSKKKRRKKKKKKKKKKERKKGPETDHLKNELILFFTTGPGSFDFHDVLLNPLEDYKQGNDALERKIYIYIKQPKSNNSVVYLLCREITCCVHPAWHRS